MAIWEVLSAADESCEERRELPRWGRGEGEPCGR